jgi:UTP--glucose-1-phosphate uridylyltransferase
MTNIRKAVFPVAGLGTRMFPASKSIPKEMLPLVDRPIIEWVVDEARAAGIEQFIFVTSRNKASIEDHFDANFELEQALARKGSAKILNDVQKRLPAPGQFLFTRQQRALGLGHAIWCARDIVGNEPFAVLLPDMVMASQKGCLAEMMSAYHQVGGNIIATEIVPKSDVSKYGIVDLRGDTGKLCAVHGLVEKPKVEHAPSTVAVSGRYILQPEIFELLAQQPPGAGGEIQLTDALLKLQTQQAMWSYRFDGHTYDCGDKLGFLKANMALALDNEDLCENVRNTMLELLQLDPHLIPVERGQRYQFR